MYIPEHVLPYVSIIIALFLLMFTLSVPVIIVLVIGKHGALSCEVTCYFRLRV